MHLEDAERQYTAGYTRDLPIGLSFRIMDLSPQHLYINQPLVLTVPRNCKQSGSIRLGSQHSPSLVNGCATAPPHRADRSLLV
jgi:hypothetical protein